MLDSLCAQECIGISWEILVCDNNSNDSTREILDKYLDKLPMSIFFEGSPGKSVGVNRLLSEVSGDFIILTDDDVLLDPDWLSRFHDLANRELKYDVFGGRVIPRYLESPPFWLDSFSYRQIAFAESPPHLNTGAVAGSWIFGPCMAFRVAVLKRGVIFDKSIGPSPGLYKMGCETKFINDLECLGCDCWFDNGIRVGHLIKPFQLSLFWILSRGYKYGLAMYEKEKLSDFGGVSIFVGLPRWIFIKFFVSLGGCFLFFVFKNPNFFWRVGYFSAFFRCGLFSLGKNKGL